MSQAQKTDHSVEEAIKPVYMPASGPFPGYSSITAVTSSGKVQLDNPIGVVGDD